MAEDSKPLQTLAVDIGGSGIKVMILDEQGNPLTERERVDTPQPATPHRKMWVETPSFYDGFTMLCGKLTN